MNKLFKKGLAFVLSLTIVAAMTPALGAGVANAEDTAAYTVTKSFVPAGTAEADAGKVREGTTVIKTYTQDEFEALATVGDETEGGIQYYMWTKNGSTYNVYKIHKGVTYASILSDAAGIQTKDEINALAGIYSYNDKECTNLYSKLNTLKSQFLGASTYTYLDGKYDSAAGSIVLGEGTEVDGIMAISYDYSENGLSEANADKTPTELDDWSADSNRMLPGVAYDAEGNMITGGFMSQSNANTGLDIVEYYDIKATFDGENAQYLAKGDAVQLPEGTWYYQKDGAYIKAASGLVAEEAAGDAAAVEFLSAAALPEEAKAQVITDQNVTIDEQQSTIDEQQETIGELQTSIDKMTAKIKVLTTAVKPTAKNIKKKSIKVTWNKITGAAKYQVSISTSKSGSSIKKTTTAKTFTKKSLKKGKTYYVKVRAVCADGTKAPWSAVKKVKIKK